MSTEGNNKKSGGFMSLRNKFPTESQKASSSNSDSGQILDFVDNHFENIESMKLAVEQSDIRAIHPDKMEEFAEYLVDQVRQSE